METTVVHWNDRGSDTDYVYIGRDMAGGYFANPYHVGRDGTRAEVLDKYMAYFIERLDTDPDFYRHIRSLKGRQLVCHCKPLDCHGDVIATYLNEEDK